MATIKQKKLIKELRKIYKKYGLKRTIYPTKDGRGVYIHPKRGCFLAIGKKRIGIFVREGEFSLKSLAEVDDELRRKMK